jgi:hypothetical protein
MHRSMYGEKSNAYKILTGNFEETDHFRNPDADINYNFWDPFYRPVSISGYKVLNVTMDDKWLVKNVGEFFLWPNLDNLDNLDTTPD